MPKAATGSTSPADPGVSAALAGAPRQPRKEPQTASENKVQSAPSTDDVSTDIPKTSASEEHSQPIEQSGFREGGERAPVVPNSPEAIHYNLVSDAATETADLGAKQTGHIVTSVVSTMTTRVEQSKDGRKSLQSTITREGVVQPRRSDLPPSQGVLQKKASFYHETHIPATPTSKALEHRRPMMLSKPTFIVEDSLTAIQQSHRQETDHILVIMRARLEEHKENQRIYEDHLEALRMENEELALRISTLASENTVLKIQFDSADDRLEPSSTNELDTTVITTITTVTTTITTVTNRIEQWRDEVVRNKGQITISRTDLDRLLSDLSSTSTQMSRLQQDYAEVSKESDTLRRRLQMTLSLHVEKDGTIASLTAKVSQLQNADSAKTPQISALRRDIERFQKESSTTSSRLAELERSCAELSAELESAREEVQFKAQLIEERDGIIASRTAEIAQMKRTDGDKTKQIATLHRDYEKLRKDSTFQTADLRERNNSLSKELDSVQRELRDSKALVEDGDNKIVVLNAEVEKWKNLDITRTKQLEAEQRDKEKLRRDFASSSSQIAEFQERCSSQTEKITSLHGDLETKVSLLAKQEHTITSITAERDQARGENAVKEQQIVTARKEVEQLRNKLSVAWDEKAALQKRFDTQLIELDELRNEHGRLVAIRPGAPDRDIAQYITDALEEKEKQIGELRRELATTTSRNNDLQKSHEALSIRIRAINDDLTAEKSRYQGTITSLTNQVDQLKATDADKTKQLEVSLKHVQELQVKLSTSTAGFAELQGRYATQSEELISMSKRIQMMTLDIQAKDHDNSSLTAERDRLASANSAKAEQIAKLQQESSSSTTQITGLRDRLKTVSDELASVEAKLKTSLSSNEEQGSKVLSLTDEIAELRRINALGENRIVTLGEQVNQLRLELTSFSSRTTELQHDNDMQLKELEALRAQIAAMQQGDHATISSLTAQVDEWKGLCNTKVEELTVARREIDQLHHDLDSSSSQLIRFQQELASQTERWRQIEASKVAELNAARTELDRLGSELNTSSSRVAGLEQDLANKTAELTTAHSELQKLHREVSKSSTQINKYESRLAELTSKVERLERSNAASEGELATARQKLEQSQRDKSTSSSDTAMLRQRCATLSAELKFLNEQLSIIPPDFTFEGSDEEWSSFQTRIIAEVKDHTDIIKLSTKVDEWLRSDAKRAVELRQELDERNKENEELRRNFATLKDIYIRAPRLKQIFQSDTIEIKRRYEGELNALQSQLKGVQRVVATADTYADEAIKQELSRLNAEVEQNTTLMAEDISKGFRPGAANATKEQILRVSKTIGPTLTKALENMQHDDVALYLSIAFQAHLSYYLCQMITSWTTEQGHNEFINNIYEKLQSEETQPMSGRWRALTRAYISPTWTNDSESLVQQIVAALSDIIVLAKCATSDADAKSRLSSFGDKVKTIISIAGQFSQMVGKVVSADFMVLAPSPLQVFGENTMEVDDYGEGKASRTAVGQKVVCSTSLGMTKRMQRESKKETLIVIKARVALESFLEG